MKKLERVFFFQPRTFAEENYQTTNGKEQRWAPWFAIFLAPLVRDLGISAHLIDARIDLDWADELRTLGETDLVAVSVITGHAIRDAVFASEIARERQAKVVWGGPHVSLFPNETLMQAPVDAVIPGFGYEPFAYLLHATSRGLWPLNGDHGVLVKSHDCQQRSLNVQPTPLPPAVLPPPSLDLVSDWEPYVNPDVAIASRTVSIITSEGCTRRCTYCSEPKTSANRWLVRDIVQVVASANDLCRRSSAAGFKLHDPNFFDNMNRALDFACQFHNEVGLPWAATMHPADLANATDTFFAQLARNGLVRVLVGLESPDPRIIRLAGKQYDPALIPELASKLARHNIRGMFTFIVGWPDAEPGHYARTIKCAFEIRDIWTEHQAKIHFLEPWPGTPIFTLLQRRGFQFPQTLAEWAEIDYYQARYAMIHDPARVREIRDANRSLSPYVDA